MRRLRFALIMGLVFLSPLTSQAQQPRAAFLAKDVDVRSGPADKYPVTGKLLANDRVLIKGKANTGEAYEIVPPDGSYSWVRDKDVTPGPSENGRATLVVTAIETTLRHALHGSNQPSNATSATIMKGRKLVGRGEKVLVALEKETYWPVDCVPEESRFISVTAVNESGAAGNLPVLPRQGSTTANEPPQWALAEQAQREGRLDDAERLFADIVRDNAPSGKDFELSLRAQNRIREIRLQRRTQFTGRPSANAGTRIPPQPDVPTFSPPVGTLPPRPGLVAPPSLIRPSPGSPSGDGRWQSSGSGWLRRSGFQIDGKQTYALEAANGQLRVYVTANSGVDLESYLNRPVELFGTMEMRGDVRGANYMRVTRVVPLR